MLISQNCAKFKGDKRFPDSHAVVLRLALAQQHNPCVCMTLRESYSLSKVVGHFFCVPVRLWDVYPTSLLRQTSPFSTRTAMSPLFISTGGPHVPQCMPLSY